MNIDELLDNFTNALDDLGIDSRTSGQSLAVELCPECGRTKFKVLFRVVGVDDEVEDGHPFMGRCLSGSCNQNFSSKTYLLAAGMDYGQICEIHGTDPQKNYQKMALVAENFELFNKDPVIAKNETVAQKPKEYDISKFFKLELLGENHPITLYAKKRGYHPAMHNMIRGEISTGSVVFLCRQPGTGEVIGYQKRFIAVPPWGHKTDTAPGFDAAQNIFRLKNQKNPTIAVCEGPFTAVAARRYGFDSVCTFGSAMSDTHKKMIYEIYKEKKSHFGSDAKIAVAKDQDAAGIKYFNKLASFLYWNDEIQALVEIVPEYGSDLNDAWMAGAGYQCIQSVDYNPALPIGAFDLLSCD